MFHLTAPIDQESFKVSQNLNLQTQDLGIEISVVTVVSAMLWPDLRLVHVVTSMWMVDGLNVLGENTVTVFVLFLSQ